MSCPRSQSDGTEDNKKNVATMATFLFSIYVVYTMPWAIIALATFKNPATLAPLT